MTDDRLLKTMRNIKRMEAGKQVVINQADAEECENRGWAEAQTSGGYRLTESGRRKLSETNSN